MPISTKEVAATVNEQRLYFLKEYFKELPIIVIKVDDGDYISKTESYYVEYGVLFRKRKKKYRTTISKAVLFSFKGKLKKIYLNDRLMQDKVGLIFKMKVDLGLR